MQLCIAYELSPYMLPNRRINQVHYLTQTSFVTNQLRNRNLPSVDTQVPIKGDSSVQ
jgi:hypothetical protein